MFGKNIYPFFSSCYLAVTTLAAVVSHKMPVVDLGYAKYQVRTQTEFNTYLSTDNYI